EAVGHVVFLTGRTEYIEKVAVPAAAFLQRGYSVISLDWRGQGLSSRHAGEGLKGHVGHFSEFQNDLDALLASDQAKALTGPRLLVGHSMGGCIATMALARPEIVSTVSAVILSAPMFGISLHPLMRAAGWLTTKIGMALGFGTRWPPFGDVTTPYVLTNPEDNVLTTDAEMISWMAQVARDHPRSSIAMPTLGWFNAATAAMKQVARLPEPDLPVLCLLGNNERVVDKSAVEVGAERMHARLIRIGEAQHEVLIESQPLRDIAWRAIDDFVQNNRLPMRAH
ncbi:MAG: alpha/beta hydrolase, partial [Pseudomonadota bacterium]